MQCQVQLRKGRLFSSTRCDGFLTCKKRGGSTVSLMSRCTAIFQSFEENRVYLYHTKQQLGYLPRMVAVQDNHCGLKVSSEGRRLTNKPFHSHPMAHPPTYTNTTTLLGGSSFARFCQQEFGEFPRPAWAVGSYSSGPAAGGTPQFPKTNRLRV